MRSANMLARSCLIVGVAAASTALAGLTMFACTSSRDGLGEDVPDGAADVFLPDVTAPDAGPGDAAPVPRSPRPVVCAVTPCATALTAQTLDLWPDPGVPVTLAYGADFRDGATYCAATKDGRVVCWGLDAEGALGRGADDAGTIYTGAPAAVTGVSGAAAISPGCAVDSAGAARCWGPSIDNTYMQDGGALDASVAYGGPVVVPLPPAVEVRIDGPVGCALLASRDVQCWGLASAVGTDGGAASVLPPSSIALPARAQSVALAGGLRDFKSFTTALVLLEDGTVYSWGATMWLGRESSLFPTDPYPTPIRIDDVSSIDAQGYNACLIRRGVVSCWGAPNGKLEPNPYYGTYYGDDLTDVPRDAVPAVIPLPEPSVQVSAADFSSDSELRRACAVAVSGDVYCWGANNYGQAGSGDRAPTSPVKVDGLPEPASVVRATPHATCALLVSGRLFCWGRGALGALGGQTFDALEPIEVKLP